LRRGESFESGRATRFRRSKGGARETGPGKPDLAQAGRVQWGCRMITLFKALPFSIFLTIVVCLFVGSGGSTGGVLNIFSFHIEALDFNVKVYWSWALFLCATVLAWAILFMMGD
jgi:hypothetical protein